MTDPNPNPTPDPKPVDPNPNPTPEPKPDPKPEIVFSPEQQAEIDRRIAATRRQAEADAKRKATEEQTAKAEEEKTKREQEEAIKRGEFDQVRSTLETSVKSVTEERDALAAKIKEFEDRDQERLNEGIKTLSDATKASDPAIFDPNASLAARLKWLDWALAEDAKAAANPVPGNGRLPDKLKGDPKADEDARRAHQRLNRAAF